MTNEVTIFGTDNYDEIAALTGAELPRGSFLPQLKINREAETEDGKTVPVGKYCVTHEGKTLYGNPAKFRPFMNTFQYMAYSPGENKFVNKTIYIKSFNEEAHDELGGLKCGKITGDAFKLLDKAEQEAQRNIKCYRVMFGIAHFDDAVDADGAKYTDVDVPCMWRITGVNFLAPKDALAAIAKMRHHMFQHYFVLSTKRDKQGSNVFYHAIVTPDLANTLTLSDADKETFTLFNDFINRENDSVLKKWDQAKRVPFDLGNDLAKDFELNDSIDL